MTKIDPSTLDFKDEPKMWEEAKHSADAKWWEEGYRDELTSLKEMGVYKLIPRCDVPQGTKICKGWPVFRIKQDKNGKAIRWKVCLVFKGFEQIYGKDYMKTTSPTAGMEPWWILLHIAASLDWDSTFKPLSSTDSYLTMKYNTWNNPRVSRKQAKRNGYGKFSRDNMAWNRAVGFGVRPWTNKCYHGGSCVYLVNPAHITGILTVEQLSRLCTSTISYPLPAIRKKTNALKTKCTGSGQFLTLAPSVLLLGSW